MSGIWRKTSPYFTIFTLPTPKTPTLPSPPPVSPLDAIQHHVDIIDDFVAPCTPVAVSTPVMAAEEEQDEEDDEYTERCKKALWEVHQRYTKHVVDPRRSYDGFGTIYGVLNLIHEIPNDEESPILDMTGSLIFPLVARVMGIKNPIVIHSAFMPINTWERRALFKLVDSLSIVDTPFDEMEEDYIKQFCRIFVNNVDKKAAPDTRKFIELFANSVSTGVIYMHSMYTSALKLSKAFKMISFEACTIKGTSTPKYFYIHLHSFLFRVEHSRGGPAKVLEHPRSVFATKNRAMAKRKKADDPKPIAEEIPPPREPSPLNVDFSFEDMAGALQEMIEVPLPVSFVDLLAPPPSAEPLPVEESLPIVEEPLPVIEEREHTVFQLDEEVVVSDETPSSSQEEPILVLDDEESLWSAVEERLSNSRIKRRLRDIRRLLPDSGAPDMGGTCPSLNETSINTMARLICEWKQTHPDAKAFLDLRSRSLLSASMFTAFSRSDLSVGQLVYSENHLASIIGLINFLQRNCAMSSRPSLIRTPLFGLESKHLQNYQMCFLLAVYMNPDNVDLLHVVSAFRRTSDTQVMWAHLMPGQYQALKECCRDLKIRSVQPIFNRHPNSCLYEITK